MDSQNVSRETIYFIFVYEILFAIANRICRGAAPADPAKGVPPFGTSLRALRGRESAVKGKNIFRIRLSRAHGYNNLSFSPCYIIWTMAAPTDPQLAKMG